MDAGGATGERTLDSLEPGELAWVTAVGGGGSFRLRLLELGLTPGTPITRLGQAPLGDPLTFRVRGAALAIRRADAAGVTVGGRPCNPPTGMV